MATKKTNLSRPEGTKIQTIKNTRIAIVYSEWNYSIIKALCKGAIDTLIKHGINKNDISLLPVPGSFELSLGAQLLARQKKTDAVICLGCVIRGETPHFDFICSAAANGITQVNLKYNKPVIFGVLTTNTMTQAKERAGGKHGNKGVEAALAALKMILLKKRLKK